MADTSLPRQTTRWRGRSNRLYDAIILDVTGAAQSDQRGRAALAVTRDKNFGIQVVRGTPQISPAWLARAAGAGAVEIHALQVPAGEAHAALDDLRVMK